ncbi:hypothetical protein NLG97_g11334 [Lecanicillium saksenae]|uniref:Uncharacterized protein n=1 Tax=Lecanicillium saksenae TaxID=468837 RepID=A0ACC1QCG7_9HYPO|nr:hypothetical protein NLG97_g11334 [Lecanicillium saksenae]
MSLNLISLSTEILTLIFAAAAAAAEPPDYYVEGEPEGTTYLGVLGNLRLTCSRARAVASPLFFRRLTLKPDDDDSVARWNAVLDSPEHRGLVRCAVFDSG